MSWTLRVQCHAPATGLYGRYMAPVLMALLFAIPIGLLRPVVV